MEPFRKHVAISIDGGGIKGVVVTKALAILEEHLGQSAHDVFRLAAGTSTGSIISAGIAAGLSAAKMFDLYVTLGEKVMAKSWRTAIWPLTRYRYPLEPLATALRDQIGDRTMGDFWSANPATDVIIPAFDLVENRSRFIKSWKPEYARWSAITAVLASSSVPTYFPPVEGRFVDGGVGSYANPCYLAAYEIEYVLPWEASETTLISLGTGRNPENVQVGDANRYWAWDWIGPVLGAFQQSADDQQVHLVNTFFSDLDFRRFQVDLREPIAMDDTSAIPLLAAYGEELGRKILADQTDRAMDIQIQRAPALE
jgi:patatin-like phospholipase/acyl hydrolase